MTNKKLYNVFPALLILFIISITYAITITGCVTDRSGLYIKNGKKYGKVKGAFRNRWWNFYERGLSFAEGEFYPEALLDLKNAFKQRNKDQRMARTYGMHFIDYFPNREIGVVYYYKGNLKAALNKLKLSLQQYPSAKAYYYLDRVREKIIKKSGKISLPPELKLNTQNEEVWSNDDPFVISGTATDNNYISKIYINQFPFFLEGSKKLVKFKQFIHLDQGIHTVTVMAKNLAGKVANKKLTVHIDREGPVVTIENIQPESDKTGMWLKITGYIYDKSGVQNVTVNNNALSFSKDREIFFSQKIASSQKELQLIASDLLGNKTIAKVPLQISESAYRFSKIKTKTNSKKPLMLACADSFTGYLAASFFKPKDDIPPSINLKGWSDSQVVFIDRIYLEGEVSDENKIVSLFVNTKPVLRRKGKNIFFSHFADLKKGENNFIIKAEDESGNTSTRKIKIIRKVPKALQLSERLSITVLPFEQKSLILNSSTDFQENLIDAMVNQNRFRIIERNMLDTILEEQKLSQTALIDRNTALKIGRLVAARSIIAGSIIKTRTGIEIIGRLVDTETSEILDTEDVYDEIQNIPSLKALAEGMAVKFHRQFPLLNGFVMKHKGKSVFIDLGADKIKLQRRLTIYREEKITHPVTGKVLGSDNIILGHARVTQVMPSLSKAEILDGKPGEIKSMDKVITE